MTIREQFVEHGYAGPTRVLSALECGQFLSAVAGDDRQPLDWNKCWAVISRPFYEIGTHPVIMELVTSVLGEDVMLWGASIQERAAVSAHPWHTDIESSAAAGKTVSVWIGLENTHRNSSLRVAAYSHRFGVSVQELRQQTGIHREETTDEDIIRWALERDSRSHVVQPDLGDGVAIFFDGALWHCSHNRSGAARRALLLQYATPDVPIYMPDLTSLDWPFRKIDTPRPACIVL